MPTFLPSGVRDQLEALQFGNQSQADIDGLGWEQQSLDDIARLTAPPSPMPSGLDVAPAHAAAAPHAAGVFEAPQPVSLALPRRPVDPHAGQIRTAWKSDPNSPDIQPRAMPSATIPATPSAPVSSAFAPPASGVPSAMPSGVAPRPVAASGIPAALPSGGAPAATPGQPFASNDERLAYVADAARRNGHDPSVAQAVARAEGAGPAGTVGDNGTSFGALQAHVGGGQGDDFRQQTGLDPSDPANERALIDWQMGRVGQTGWAPFHGAAAAGIGQWQGIGTGATNPVASRQTVSQAPSGQPAAMPSSGSAYSGPYTQQALADAGDPDAWAKCGPVAAYQFALKTGRSPTPAEAEKLARDAGWTPQRGMAGLASEAAVLTGMGIAARSEQGVDWNKVITDVSRGNPVILQLPGHEGHYITAQGYDAQTGKIDFGSTVGDLRAAGHKTQFTPSELEGLGWGVPNASLYVDNPATPAPSVAAAPTAGASRPADSPTPSGSGGPPTAAGSAATQDAYKLGVDIPETGLSAGDQKRARLAQGQVLPNAASGQPQPMPGTVYGGDSGTPNGTPGTGVSEATGRDLQSGLPATGVHERVPGESPLAPGAVPQGAMGFPIDQRYPGDRRGDVVDEDGIDRSNDPNVRTVPLPSGGRITNQSDHPDVMYRQSVAGATPRPGTDEPIQNPDGSVTTERSITVTEPGLNGGRATNIPTVWNGRIVSDDEAVQNAIRSGVAFPSFGSIDEAVRAAEQRSRDLGAGQTTSVGGASVPWEVQNALPNRNRPVRGGPIDESGGLQYRQPIAATGGPDSSTGQEPTSSYNDPTDGGTLSQPLPSQAPSPADDPGGAQFAAQDAYSTPQSGSVSSASDEGQKQEPFTPPPGLQAVYDAGGRFLHWIQGQAQGAADTVNQGLASARNAAASVDQVDASPTLGAGQDLSDPLSAGAPLDQRYTVSSPVTRALNTPIAAPERRPYAPYDLSLPPEENARRQHGGELAQDVAAIPYQAAEAVRSTIVDAATSFANAIRAGQEGRPLAAAGNALWAALQVEPHMAGFSVAQRTIDEMLPEARIAGVGPGAMVGLESLIGDGIKGVNALKNAPGRLLSPDNLARADEAVTGAGAAAVRGIRGALDAAPERVPAPGEMQVGSGFVPQSSSPARANLSPVGQGLMDTYDAVTPQRVTSATDRALQVAGDALAGKIPPRGGLTTPPHQLVEDVHAALVRNLDDTKTVMTGMRPGALAAYVRGEGMTSKVETRDLPLINRITQDQVNVEGGRAQIVDGKKVKVPYTLQDAADFAQRESEQHRAATGGTRFPDPQTGAIDEGAPRVMYGYVGEGQPLVGPNRPTLWVAWEPDTPRVSSLNHPFGAFSPGQDIHANMAPGNKAMVYDPKAVRGGVSERAAIGPSGRLEPTGNETGMPLVRGWEGQGVPVGSTGRKIADTHLLVGPNGESDLRAAALLTGMPQGLQQAIARGWMTDPEQIAAVLMRGGSPQWGAGWSSVLNPTRTETLIVDPHISNARAIYITGTPAQLHESVPNTGGKTVLQVANQMRDDAIKASGGEKNVPILFTDITNKAASAKNVKAGVASNAGWAPPTINDAKVLAGQPLERGLSPGRGRIVDQYTRATDPATGQPYTNIGVGAVPSIGPGIRNAAYNAAQGGVVGAYGADQQAQQQGREATPGERLAYGAAGAGLAVMAGNRGARAAVGRALGSGFVPRGQTVEVLQQRLAQARGIVDRVIESGDPQRIAQAQEARAAIESQLVDAQNARRGLEPRIASDVGRRESSIPPSAQTVENRVDAVRPPRDGRMRPEDLSGPVSIPVDNPQMRLGSGVVPAEEPRYDPRLSQEPVLPGFEDQAPRTQPAVRGEPGDAAAQAEMRAGGAGALFDTNALIPDIARGPTDPHPPDWSASPVDEVVRAAQEQARVHAKAVQDGTAELPPLPPAGASWWRRTSMENARRMAETGQEPLSPVRWLNRLAQSTVYSALIGPPSAVANFGANLAMPILSTPRELVRPIARAAQTGNVDALREYPTAAWALTTDLMDVGKGMVDALAARGRFAQNPNHPMLSGQTINPFGQKLAEGLELGNRAYSALPDAIFGSLATNFGERRAAAQMATDLGLHGGDWGAISQGLIQDARTARSGAAPSGATTGELVAALKQADEQGLKGADRQRQVGAWLQQAADTRGGQLTPNPDIANAIVARGQEILDGIVDAGKAYGDHQTFRDHLGEIGKAARTASGADLPVVGPAITPFFNTNWNVWKRLGEHTPLGPALNRSRPTYDKAFDAAFGTLVLAGIANYATSGVVTGSGPSDPQARKDLESQGWQRYSTLVDGVYVPNRLLYGIMEGPMNMAGDWHDHVAYQKPEDAWSQKAFEDMASRVGQQIRNAPTLTGWANVLDAMSGQGLAGKLERYGASQVTSHIPYASTARAIGTSQDAAERIVERGRDVPPDVTMGQQIASGVGARSALPVNQDSLGRPKENQQSGLWAFMPKTSTERPDPTIRAFTDAGMTVPAPPDAVDGVKLSPAQQRRYQEVMGRELQRLAAPSINGGNWKAMPPETKKILLEAFGSTARTLAEVAVSGEGGQVFNDARTKAIIDKALGR